jgi:hypothetical protein
MGKMDRLQKPNIGRPKNFVPMESPSMGQVPDGGGVHDEA